MNEAEQEERRLGAEVSAAQNTERAGDPTRPDSDRVEVNFDWLVPSRADEPLTFHLDIARGDRTSVVRFALGLAKLAGADLQRLHESSGDATERLPVNIRNRLAARCFAGTRNAVIRRGRSRHQSP
jgi:hypothetical protein